MQGFVIQSLKVIQLLLLIELFVVIEFQRNRKRQHRPLRYSCIVNGYIVCVNIVDISICKKNIAALLQRTNSTLSDDAIEMGKVALGKEWEVCLPK